MAATRPALLTKPVNVGEFNQQKAISDLVDFINAMLSWRGTAQIAVAGTSVVVTHGVKDANGAAAAPTRVMVTPRNDPQQRFWVSSITSTQFTISVSAAIAATAVNFDWSAYLND
jgi:hypothetical protein